MKKKLLAILLGVAPSERVRLLQELRDVVSVFSPAGKPRHSRRADPPTSRNRRRPNPSQFVSSNN